MSAAASSTNHPDNHARDAAAREVMHYLHEQLDSIGKLLGREEDASGLARPCQFSDCQRDRVTPRWCATHALSFMEGRAIEPPAPPCAEPSCSRASAVIDYCYPHSVDFLIEEVKEAVAQLQLKFRAIRRAPLARPLHQVAADLRSCLRPGKEETSGLEWMSRLADFDDSTWPPGYGVQIYGFDAAQTYLTFDLGSGCYDTASPRFRRAYEELLAALLHYFIEGRSQH